MPDLDQPTSILSPSLKRKRPPGLEIPNVLGRIRADVAESNTDSFSGPGVGVFSLKGKKRFMEDAYRVVSCYSDQIKGFFGVYDGHGGKKAAEFVTENLHTNIFEMLKNCTSDETKKEAVEAGYLKTDTDFLKQGVSSGACCVTALIEGGKIVISNVGDCRAVLCRGGVAEALTIDHRAENDFEKKRIESKGGYVEMHRGAWRVHGILSVSRSIGDAHLKDWVTADPDTIFLQLSPNMDYLILASDGLWEKVGNQEAADIMMGSCRNQKKMGPIKHDENDGKFRLMQNSSLQSNIKGARLIEQKKRMFLSPLKRKIVRRREIEDEFPSKNEGPSLKARRVSAQFQDQENCNNNGKYNSCEFPSENEGLPLKARSVSAQFQFQDQENSNNNGKYISCEFPSENEGPPLKARRVSAQFQFQDQENSNNNGKYISCEFSSENEGPPLKARRVGAQFQFQDQENSNNDGKYNSCEFLSENEGPPLKAKRVSVQFQNQENSNNNGKYNSSELVSACNELVNLALSRGSLDDITVMIIDLNHFK